MKNSPFTPILLAVLGVSAVWSIVSCSQYSSNTQQIRGLQNQLATIQYKQNAFQSLLTDTTEYGKTHPKLDPILESIGYKRNNPAPQAPPRR